MQKPLSEKRSEPMSLVDWVVAAVATVMAVVLGATPYTVSVAFGSLLMELGSLEELPLVTQVMLTSSYVSTWSALTVVVTGSALFLGRRVLWRRAILVLGSIIGLAGVGVYIFAVYAPFFELAHVIGP